LVIDDELDDRADRGINDDTVSIASSSVTSEKLDPDIEVTPYDFALLPAHHCAYCGIHSPCSVVKCMYKDCNKWFCNGNSISHTSSSHIIMHLVKSRHKEIQLHPESELKDANLECHACKSTNIFLLGFMPAKTEAYVILLCREPCLRQLSQKESVYDTENWHPLIDDKK
jgi:regulator of nonsense transcripts 1